MHPDYYLKQRFFALIEIGSKPFIEGQGPASFGPFQAASHVEIHNGVLGLSSHHSIHGSDVRNVHIHDVEMRDFEVAGVHLNGALRTTIRDCDIGPSLTEVPVLGTLSNAIFLLPELRKAADANPTFTISFGANEKELSLYHLVEELQEAISQGPDHDVFSNPSGLPDGSAVYGIVIHRIGVAIGDLGAGTYDEQASTKIERVNIHDLRLNAIEWGSIVGPNAFGTGPFGDKINFDWVIDENGVFNGGNILFKCQLALAVVTGRATDRSFSGAFSLGTSEAEQVLAWTQSQQPITEQFWFQSKEFDTDSATPKGIHSHDASCGTDVMSHSIKGAFGMRLEFSDSIQIRNVSISNVQATLEKRSSSQWCPMTGVSTHAERPPPITPIYTAQHQNTPPGWKNDAF